MGKPKKTQLPEVITSEVVKPEVVKKGRPLVWTEEKVMKLGEDLYNWMIEDEKNIWFETFLYENGGIYHQFISEMCKKYPSFSDVIKKCKKLQEAKLINSALNNKTNTAMTIFLLKNHHGYKDKQEQDVNHKGDGIVINVVKPKNDKNDN